MAVCNICSNEFEKKHDWSKACLPCYKKHQSPCSMCTKDFFNHGQRWRSMCAGCYKKQPRVKCTGYLRPCESEFIQVKKSRVYCKPCLDRYNSDHDDFYYK